MDVSSDLSATIIMTFAVPVVFCILDAVTKFNCQMSTEDIGADICLVGAAASLTIAADADLAERLGTSTGIAALLLLCALVGYMCCLTVVSPPVAGRSYPAVLRWIRLSPLRVPVTVLVGVSLVGTELLLLNVRLNLF